MQRWLSFGASEIGPAHIKTGKPNQDSWASFHHADCDVLAVSDGVGSKDYSEFGSAMACRAVDHAVCSALIGRKALDFGEPMQAAEFFDDVRDAWIEGIAPLTSSNASATCLFGLRTGDGNLWLGMLGDGMAAAILDDGTVRLLRDSKEEGFSNITKSLSEKTQATDWMTMSVPEKRCKAILLCTDGVADDLEDEEGFARYVVDNLCILPVIYATSKAVNMLIDWPTPKHSDDKTMACLFKREYRDE